MSTDESLYHASPQTRGRAAHNTIDNNTFADRKSITSLSVISNKLELIGKIDIYKPQKKLLIERKFRLDNIYKGQLYQLWSQYYCMSEMGYDVELIEFYETSRNRHISVPLPGEKEYNEIIEVIDNIRTYNPLMPLKTNINKCRHCIYCNMCDKTTTDNVYT